MTGVFELDYPGPLAWTLASTDPDRCQVCGKELEDEKSFKISTEIEGQIYVIVYHLDCAKPFLKLRGEQ